MMNFASPALNPTVRLVQAERCHILAIPGSVRWKSYSRAALRAAAHVLPTGATMDVFDLADLPPFDPAAKGTPALRVEELKRQIRAADAVLFAVPEYSYGLLTVLDNAIESAGQPESDNGWTGKPVAVIGCSLALNGVARAQHHLRARLEAKGMRPIAQPPFLVGQADRAFDRRGELINKAQREVLRQLLNRLSHAAWPQRDTTADVAPQPDRWATQPPQQALRCA